MNTVVLDLGHGGLLGDGSYTTAPAKMWTFPNGEISYEGVINRKFGKIIGDKLSERGVDVQYTVDPSDPTDVSLRERVEFSKTFSKTDAIFVSVHCNAFNTSANGTEIYTTVGQTKSDILATYIIESVKDCCPELKMRLDFSDGDADKESQFYVIRKTPLYAVLLECLFFDHWESYLLTKDDDFVNRFCEATVDGIMNFLVKN